jgi:hypothetical protein
VAFYDHYLSRDGVAVHGGDFHEGDDDNDDVRWQAEARARAQAEALHTRHLSVQYHRGNGNLSNRTIGQSQEKVQTNASHQT